MRQDHPWGDEFIEFPLHQLELVTGRLVIDHGVIDENTRQVEKACKPGNHEKQMEGFKPHKVDTGV